MKIEEININQFRSLNNVHINLNYKDSAGIAETFLVAGASASGKTSVLDAVIAIISEFHEIRANFVNGENFNMKVHFTDQEIEMLQESNNGNKNLKKVMKLCVNKSELPDTFSWMENEDGVKEYNVHMFHVGLPEIVYFRSSSTTNYIEEQFQLVKNWCFNQDSQFPKMTEKYNKIKSKFDNFIEGWKVSTRKDAILEHKNKHFNFSEIPSSIRELFRWFLYIIMHDSQKSFEGNVILMDRMNLLSKLHQATFLAKRFQVFPKFQFIFTSSDVMPDWHHNHQLEG